MKMLEDQEKGADFRLTGIKSCNQPYLTKFIFSFLIFLGSDDPQLIRLLVRTFFLLKFRGVASIFLS